MTSDSLKTADGEFMALDFVEDGVCFWGGGILGLGGGPTPTPNPTNLLKPIECLGNSKPIWVLVASARLLTRCQYKLNTAKKPVPPAATYASWFPLL